MGSLLDGLFSGIAALLAFCYSFTGNYALAIGAFTLIIMLVFTPLTLKSTRSMMAMQRLQPEMKRIQTKYKDDRQTLNEEMMALYQREGVNPLGGCLPMIIQMPVFLILFQVLRGLTRSDDAGTGFNPKYLDENTELFKDLVAGNGEMVAFGVDLARQANEVVQDNLVDAIPYIIMVGITALTSWFQQKQMAARRTDTPQTPQAAQQQAIMKFLPWMLPIFSFFMPAGLVVYFIVSNLYRVGQQSYIQKTLPSPDSIVVEAEGTSRPSRGSKAPKNKDSRAIEPAGDKNTDRPATRSKSSRSQPPSDAGLAAEANKPSASRPRPRPRANTRGRTNAARPEPGSSARGPSDTQGSPAPSSRTGGSDGLNRSKNKKKRKKR